MGRSPRRSRREGEGPGGETPAETGGSLPGRSRAVPLADLLALLSVPVVLLAVHALPEPAKRRLALSYADPTALSAVAAHFVHLDTGHLLANLGAYVLVAGVGYLLCRGAGRRSEFLVAFAVFLLVFPAVLSGLNLALARPRLGYGFSGVLTAFFGFLPLALTWYLASGVGVPVGGRDAAALFFGSTTLIALLALPPSTGSLAVAAAAAASTAAHLRGIRPRVRSLWRRLRVVWRRTPGRAELALVATLMVVAFPVAAFPSAPAGGGRVVNVYSHLLGFAIGFVASYVTFCLVGSGAPEASSTRPVPPSGMG